MIPNGMNAARHVKRIEQHIPPKKKARHAREYCHFDVVLALVGPSNSFFGLK